jgi:hypothetical protein
MAGSAKSEKRKQRKMPPKSRSGKKKGGKRKLLSLRRSRIHNRSRTRKGVRGFGDTSTESFRSRRSGTSSASGSRPSPGALERDIAAFKRLLDRMICYMLYIGVEREEEVEDMTFEDMIDILEPECRARPSRNREELRNRMHRTLASLGNKMDRLKERYGEDNDSVIGYDHMLGSVHGLVDHRLD